MEKDTLRMQFLSGVITESEYKAIINKEIEDAEKASLNESMIGGIVGIGAINQIPPRAKADYETAFEHFLGEKYGLNEVEEVKKIAAPIQQATNAGIFFSRFWSIAINIVKIKPAVAMISLNNKWLPLRTFVEAVKIGSSKRILAKPAPVRAPRN